MSPMESPGFGHREDVMAAFNLPPGVRGDEYEIAGPDSEREAAEFCAACGRVQPGLVASYGPDLWFTCDACGRATDLQEAGEPDPWPDPYDVAVERELEWRHGA